MEKKIVELECEIMEMYVDSDLQLIIPHPVEIWDTAGEEPIQAFEVDVDGDLQGVNGYDLEDYLDEIAEIKKDLSGQIVELYKNVLSDEYLLTGLDNEEINPLVEDEIIEWTSKECYDHYENTLSAKNRVPIVNYLATHPLDSGDILVAENCIIKHVKAGE